MRIGIDPGHGGRDPGAVGPTRLYEKDVTLAISLELSKLLQGAGLDTYITRPDDRTMELITRSALINNMKCDLAISVHINSATAQASYVSAFIQATGGEAEKLAKKVQAELVQATGWPDGEVRVQNLHMTRETNMPAILCECGFISNPEQEVQLRSAFIRDKIAQAIADGVLAYLGIEQKEAATMTSDEALVILKDKDVISEVDYWKKAIGCVKYLDTLVINMASKLK